MQSHEINKRNKAIGRKLCLQAKKQNKLHNKKAQGRQKYFQSRRNSQSAQKHHRDICEKLLSQWKNKKNTLVNVTKIEIIRKVL